jgi:hypothetical protein
MKANELRIGNFVQDNLGVVKIGLNAEVKFADIYNGIPITKEWLSNFGFIDLKERCGLNGIYSIIGKKGNINIETMSYCEIDYEGSVNDIVKIEYVHELQNLFYALNKQELTYGGNK